VDSETMQVEERARADSRRKSSHSARLRSGCRKQSLSLDGPRCRDLMLPLFPLFPFLGLLRSLISQEGAYPKK
jgi:hypothetical protein